MHYSAHLDGTNARDEALEALRILHEIITALFSPIGPSLWLINQVPGEFYVARDMEVHPVVKHFLIPASVLVSPNYRWSPEKVDDDERYQDTFAELTDEEFVEHRKNPGIWPAYGDED